MDKSQTVLIPFVKTPGLSPIKSRLAEEVGESLAIEFYLRSLTALKAILAQLKVNIPGLAIHWSVAETEGLVHPLWQDYPRYLQPNTDLGGRLAAIYQQGLSDFTTVCLLGVDSAHIPVEQWSYNIHITQKSQNQSFTIAPTIDGGFYYFGGSLPIPTEIWQAAPYSSDGTAKEIIQSLTTIAPVKVLPQNLDIDVFADLQAYKKLFSQKSSLLPEQLELINWVNDTLLKDRGLT